MHVLLVQRMAILELPDELMSMIFSLLPAEKLVKFTILSRPLNQVISSKYFIHLHLSHNKKWPKKLLVINQDDKSLHVFSFVPEMTTTRIDLGVENNWRWSHILGTCNGLMLIVSEKDRKMIVINPLTRKFRYIPVEEFESLQLLKLYGFGYDSCSDEYKIVQITRPKVPDKQGRKPYSVHVYGMRTCLWRKVLISEGKLGDKSEFVGVVRNSLVMPLVNGSLHWVVRDTGPFFKCRILALSLSTETVNEIPFPREVGRRPLISIKVLDGCLSLNFHPEFDRRDPSLHIMKEYGTDSWLTFKYRVHRRGGRVDPVCCLGETEVICVHADRGREWLRCGLMNDGTMREVAGGRTPFKVRGRYCSAFVETIVSPNL